LIYGVHDVYGLIAGDMIGSVYEHRRVASYDFPLFHPRSTWTDDTVLGLAVADAIVHGTPYGEALRSFARRYPDAGFGGSFTGWFNEDDAPPYSSWGNGSAMRVAAVGYAFDSLDLVLSEARSTALPTHDHPEGIRGAQAVAGAVLLARTGRTREQIREFVTDEIGYDLSVPVEQLRRTYSFDVSCQGSVPQAIRCFLESKTWEEAVRNAVYIGGDSDTLAAIAGSIAEAFYGGIPKPVVRRVQEDLPQDLLSVLEEFVEQYGLAGSLDASTQVLAGPLRTDDEDSDFSMGSSHSEESVQTSAAVRDSEYFQHNVGFMPSDAVDVSSMTPVEVDAASDDEPAVEMEDLYSVEATQARECGRTIMRETGRWFHDNGSAVPESKHMVISTPAMHVQRASEVARITGAVACIPDFLLFLNLHNVYESLRFFLHTADAIHVFLDDFPPDDIGRATRHSTAPADRKEALQTRSAMVWLINQLYWSERIDGATWYTSNRSAAMELLGDRVAAARVKALPG